MSDLTAPSWETPRPDPVGVRVRWRRGPAAAQALDLLGHDGSVDAVAVGVIDGEPVIVSGGRDRTVRLWDARTGVVRGEPFRGHSEPVRAVAIGLVDGDPLVVSGTGDSRACEASWGSLSLWDTRRGVLRSRFGGFWVDAVVVGAVDGEPVVVWAGEDGTDEARWGIAGLRDARTGRPRGRALYHREPVGAVALGHIAGQPALISRDRDGVCLWDARSGGPWLQPGAGGAEEPKAERGPRRTVVGEQRQPLDPDEWAKAIAVGFLADQPVIACRDPDTDTVWLWDARTGTHRAGPVSHDDWVHAVAAGVLDDRHLVTSLTHVGFVDGHPVVVSGTYGGVVRVRGLRGNPSPSAETHAGGVRAVAAGLVDGRLVVASAGFDSTVGLWDARTGDLLGEPLPGGGTDVAVGVVDGQPVVVSGGEWRKVCVWDVRTGQRRQTFSHPVGLDDSDTICVAVGPVDDQPIVVSGGGRTVRLWDAVTGAARGEPLRGRRWGRRHSHRAEVTAVAIGNVDGTPIVVSAARDGTLRRWDARRARPCGGPMRGHDGKVTAVAVGLLGGEATIVSGGADGTVRCWDARRGRPSGEPCRGHRGSVTAVAIGPIDGRPTVISGGADGTVRLWAADGTAVLPIRLAVTSIAIVDGGLAVGTSSSLLVVDVPGLSP